MQSEFFDLYLINLLDISEIHQKSKSRKQQLSEHHDWADWYDILFSYFTLWYSLKYDFEHTLF